MGYHYCRSGYIGCHRIGENPLQDSRVGGGDKESWHVERFGEGVVDASNFDSGRICQWEEYMG